MPIRLSYDGGNKPCSQELRKNMTRQERHLWYDFLKSYPVQFHRQKQFGRYIVDFYCSRAALVVELGGSQHYDPSGKQYDEKRAAYLRELGLSLRRYNNRDVDERFEAVCQDIDEAVREGLQNLAE